MQIARGSRIPGWLEASQLRQRGQAAVEMTLSLGLLLVLLVGALDLGRVYFAHIALVNAAREGARSGVFSQSPEQIEPAVRQEIAGNNLDPGSLTVTYWWGGSGQPVVVTTTYQINLITTSILQMHQVTLRTSATMLLP
jgi:Flp pilus assembly protein TadG